MILLYLISFYVVVNAFGYLIEKIRIPKIYAALFLGVGLSSASKISLLVDIKPVNILSEVGMFSLLFLLGYGLDFKKIKKQSGLILRITAYVILSEFIVGITILHFVFNVDFLLASIIAVSFATVGEVALLPLLREFRIIDTNLGQTILGVAVLDDVVEILAFILVITVLRGVSYSEFVMEVLPFVAIMSGLVVKNVFKFKKRDIEKYINFFALSVFGPIFFFSAGMETDLGYLVKNIFLILLFTLAIKLTKILSAYLASHKKLGTKKSIVLGVSLGIKFSTSIVILIILLQDNLITQELFSVLIGIKVVFKFVVPVVLSVLLNKWNLELVGDEVTSSQIQS